MNERRGAARIKTEWQAHIYLGNTVFNSPVKNISLGGTELNRPDGWHPECDEQYRICIKSDGRNKKLDVNMQICWVSKTSVGLKYHDLQLREKIQLNKIISDLTRDTVLMDTHVI